MSHLSKIPNYCPEDKDIFDFVLASGTGLAEFKSFLASRGCYVASEITKRNLAEFLARETFSYVDVVTLLELSHAPRSKEATVVTTHKTENAFEDLERAVEKVKSHRLEKYGDSVTITAEGSGRYRVNVVYTETFYEKTRLIQRLERETDIILEKTSDGFDCKSEIDPKIREIEAAILGEFEVLAKERSKPVASIAFLLSTLPSREDKIRFFEKLMEGIPNFTFSELRTSRIRSIADPAVEIDVGSEDQSETYAPQIESMVMSGRNLSSAGIYADCMKKDFFPMSATWQVVSDTDDYPKAELKASFSPSRDDFELQYTVNAVWSRSKDGVLLRSKPNPIAVDRFIGLLRTATVRAFSDIRTQFK